MLSYFGGYNVVDEEEDELGDDLIVDNSYEEDEVKFGENGGRTSSFDDIVHSEDERVMMDNYGHRVYSDAFLHLGATNFMPVNTNLSVDQFSSAPHLN